MALRTRLCNLTNEVHPIFNRKNFRNVSDAEYDALVPALRLATRLLTTPELAHPGHAVLVRKFGFKQDDKRHSDDGKVHSEDRVQCPWGDKQHSKDDEQHTEDESWEGHFFEAKKEKLSTRDMALYNLCLLMCVDSVGFVAEENLESVGLCHAVPEIVVENTHSVSGSTITIHKASVRQLAAIRDELHEESCAWNWEVEQEYRMHSLCFAILLMHELMHAFVGARLVHEWIPFENSPVMESGYEWEAQIFGGMLRVEHVADIAIRGPEYTGDLLVLLEWPAPSIVRIYQTKDWPIQVFEELSDIERAWDVCGSDTSWLDQLFLDSFWLETVPLKGADALKAPKHLGWRYVVSPTGQPLLYDHRSKALRQKYGNTIPEGYVEDNSGTLLAVGSPAHQSLSGGIRTDYAGHESSGW